MKKNTTKQPSAAPQRQETRKTVTTPLTQLKKRWGQMRRLVSQPINKRSLFANK